ncbi:hypothetical protein QUB13_27040 [Microcoleus sp. B4-D4]
MWPSQTPPASAIVGKKTRASIANRRHSIRAGSTRQKIASSRVKSVKSVLNIGIAIQSIQAPPKKTDTCLKTPVASSPKL